MANFYTDNEDIKFHLGHPLMEKIVALKERNYTEAQQYDNAPRDFEDAFDNYDKVLEIVGEICGDVVAVNAESVDAEGPQVVVQRLQVVLFRLRELRETSRQHFLVSAVLSLVM